MLSDLIRESDLAYIRSAYPLLEVRSLSTQQEKFLLYVVRGASVKDAADHVGMSTGAAYALYRSEQFKVLADYLREVILGMSQTETKITREMLNMMLLEAHSKAATATEEIAAVRELGKMNDLYLDAQRKAGVEVKIDIHNLNERSIERLSDSELIELSDADYSLEPCHD